MDPILRPVAVVKPTLRALEGAGFPVRRPYPTATLPQVDPFVLLDEMGPVEWDPGAALGAPDHPHRGFETVTYVLAGKLAHKDSTGGGGLLDKGDVQWMTAGAGIVHSEMPEEEFKRAGGVMHGFQLWVNLPAREKWTPPRYQERPSARIPLAASDDAKVKVRVIAGESLGEKALVETRTPILYLHASIAPGGSLLQAVPRGWNAAAYVFSGEAASAPDATAVRDGELAVFGAGDSVRLSVPDSAREGAELLLIAGEPIGEPMARWGPFVMNTRAEIEQAIADYQSGKMGRIRPAQG